MILITNAEDDSYAKNYSTKCLHFITGYTQDYA